MGRHRSSSRTLNLSLLATLTAILLAAIAIVLWRNDALPEAAGASTTATPTSGAAPTTAAEDDPTAADDSSSTGDFGTENSGGVTLPPLPGDPGDGTTLPGDPGDGTTLPGETGGDLGLSVPASAPACDGSFIVVLASVTDPAQSATGVQSWLDQFPGSQYLLTEGSCTSLRQATPEGNPIYAVYAGPYADQGQACSVRAKYGAGAYVKVLDDETPPEQIASC